MSILLNNVSQAHACSLLFSETDILCAQPASLLARLHKILSELECVYKATDAASPETLNSVALGLSLKKESSASDIKTAISEQIRHLSGCDALLDFTESDPDNRDKQLLYFVREVSRTNILTEGQIANLDKFLRSLVLSINNRAIETPGEWNMKL